MIHGTSLVVKSRQPISTAWPNASLVIFRVVVGDFGGERST